MISRETLRAGQSKVAAGITGAGYAFDYGRKSLAGCEEIKVMNSYDKSRDCRAVAAG